MGAAEVRGVSTEKWNRNLPLLALGHGVTDTYSNFLPGLIIFLTERLALSNTLVGVLATVVSISGSMSQLLFGLLADRVHRPYFLVIGPAMAALFMSLLGSAHSVPMLILLLMLGGVGVAGFHPSAAVAAGAGHPRRRAYELSLFITAGTIGYALGPVVATGVATHLGLERTWMAALPGCLLALLLYRTVYRRLTQKPLAGAKEEAAALPEAGAPAAPGQVSRSLLCLWGIVALRSATVTGFVQFMPLYLLHERGLPASQSSGAVLLFLFSGAVGGMVGGHLSDRWGRRRVLVASLALSAPLLLSLTYLSSVSFLAMLFLAGAVLSAAAAVNLAMAQEVAPRRQGIASAIVQGAAFGAGGLLAVLIGHAADLTSIGVVFRALAFVPLLTVPVALALPETFAGRATTRS